MSDFIKKSAIVATVYLFVIAATPLAGFLGSLVGMKIALFLGLM